MGRDVKNKKTTKVLSKPFYTRMYKIYIHNFIPVIFLFIFLCELRQAYGKRHFNSLNTPLAISPAFILFDLLIYIVSTVAYTHTRTLLMCRNGCALCLLLPILKYSISKQTENQQSHISFLCVLGMIF